MLRAFKEEKLLLLALLVAIAVYPLEHSLLGGGKLLADLGKMAAGEVDHPAVERGAKYLADTQGDDGFWNEPRFTATGFPRVFYLRYHGYSKFFPLWALARYRNLKSGNAERVAFGM